MAEIGDVIPAAAIYTDGGCLLKNPSPYGGMWSWCAVDTLDARPLIKNIIVGGVNSEQKIIAHDSGLVQVRAGQLFTNNNAEMIAAVKALEAMPDGWTGVLYSDSEVTLGRLFKNHALNGLAPNVVERMRAVLKRVGKVKGVLLQGHPTRADLATGIGKKRGLPVSVHNVFCDNECKRLAKEWATKNNSNQTS